MTLACVAVAIAACSSKPPPTPAQSANQLLQQGLHAEQKGQTDLAITDFKASIAKNPASAFAYYDLGVIYQQQRHDTTQAEAWYRKALLANENYKPALFNLAIIETSTDPQGAIQLYNQLLALNANDANVNFNLGLLLIAQNQPVPGHADLKKAITLNPALASRVPKGITP